MGWLCFQQFVYIQLSILGGKSLKQRECTTGVTVGIRQPSISSFKLLKGVVQSLKFIECCF